MTGGGQLVDSGKSPLPTTCPPPLENPQSHTVYLQCCPASRRMAINERSYLIQRLQLSKFEAHLT